MLSDNPPRIIDHREPVKPFLKWLGGKRWLMPLLKDKLAGIYYNRYFEPFLGGGAFFFHFRCKPAVLSDLNNELINAYLQVRDNLTDLLRLIKAMPVNADTYYEVRKNKPANLIDRAVRFLYLNRTAFSGIYRVNSKGYFNVPFGYYKQGMAILWRENLVMKASEALKEAEIVCSDFEVQLNKAQIGDLIYCDPTFTVMHSNNRFHKYNESYFSWADQERLAKACHEAAHRGATIIVSNAYHSEILELYQGFDVFAVERNSVICPNPARRKRIKEYLFIRKH